MEQWIQEINERDTTVWVPTAQSAQTKTIAVWIEWRGSSDELNRPVTLGSLSRDGAMFQPRRAERPYDLTRVVINSMSVREYDTTQCPIQVGVSTNAVQREYERANAADVRALREGFGLANDTMAVLEPGTHARDQRLDLVKQHFNFLNGRPLTRAMAPFFDCSARLAGGTHVLPPEQCQYRAGLRAPDYSDGSTWMLVPPNHVDAWVTSLTAGQRAALRYDFMEAPLNHWLIDTDTVFRTRAWLAENLVERLDVRDLSTIEWRIHPMRARDWPNQPQPIVVRMRCVITYTMHPVLRDGERFMCTLDRDFPPATEFADALIEAQQK